MSGRECLRYSFLKYKYLPGRGGSGLPGYLDVMNGLVEEEVLHNMKGSGSYGIMVDESTDVGTVWKGSDEGGVKNKVFED